MQRSVPGRPVARLLSPAVWQPAALAVAAAVVCVLGVLLADHALHPLSDEVEPALGAHDRYTAATAAMAAAADDWALTGEPSAQSGYAETDAMRLAAELELADIVDGDAVLEVTVSAERAAVEAWVRGYAAPTIAAPPGAPDPERAAVGRELAAEVQGAERRTGAELAQHLADARDAASLRLRLTALAALLVLVAALLLVARTRSRLARDVAEPLAELEQVVQRMLRNDPEGRAGALRGPQEVRSIARALNDLADAGLRARAVEGRIQDELHVLDSAKDDFVSNVSHELRTPLTTISGYLEMVADEFEGRLEPRHARMLEATRRNVVRLRALIDDLLALSRAETRPSELEPSDVTAMVTDAVTDVRMTAARRGIAVDVEAPDEALLVVCDRAMLYRAFLNVLTNAVKFSHDDGTVEVTVKRVLNRVEVAVRDHGIGIPRAELDRLGTRFFRASNAMTNEIAGTGLGLRIVQTIIDKHAGDVVLESAEGVGTTVYVRLRLHGERAARTRTSDDTGADTARPGLRHPSEL
ncbi:HAMP domain-containing sensor histidine kinase [Nocardioides sp. C4-1]